MQADELLRRQREARLFWHELDEPPRRAVQIRRPNEGEVVGWRDDFSVETLTRIAGSVVVGWRGFTDADLLGAHMAASDPSPFTIEIFKEWAQDYPAVTAGIAQAAVNAYKTTKIEKADAAKNSGTS